jgi:hypothetical protein
MKKLFGVLLALFLLASVSAQESETYHKMWVGGEVTFGSLSDLDFTFGPTYGYMLTDQWAAGGTLVFSTGNNANAWGLEFFGRYYLPLATKLKVFGDPFLRFGGGDSDTTTDGGEYNIFDVGARIGLQYWFASSWSFALYNNVILYDSRDGNGDFGAGVNLNQVNISFFFHFM